MVGRIAYPLQGWTGTAWTTQWNGLTGLANNQIQAALAAKGAQHTYVEKPVGIPGVGTFVSVYVPEGEPAASPKMKIAMFGGGALGAYVGYSSFGLLGAVVGLLGGAFGGHYLAR